MRPHGLQLHFLARTAPMLQTEPAQGERARERGVRGLRGEELCRAPSEACETARRAAREAAALQCQSKTGLA